MDDTSELYCLAKKPNGYLARMQMPCPINAVNVADALDPVRNLANSMSLAWLSCNRLPSFLGRRNVKTPRMLFVKLTRYCDRGGGSR